jgi:hypothetical protein
MLIAEYQQHEWAINVQFYQKINQQKPRIPKIIRAPRKIARPLDSDRI